MAMEGKFEMQSSEHFEEFVKELGLNVDMTNVDLSKTSTMQISKDGETYHMKSETAGISHEVRFKLGEEFEDDMNGHKFKNVVTLDGEHKMVQKKTSADGGKTVNVVREFSDAGCTVRSTYNNVTWTRVYKRV
ncbi:Group 13 mite allergen-like protein (Lipocalin) [Euroglyphus maynei]|uniref:Group 13 mite allergen-like protein (Lipocalin) n=1 Tax=Euroglyphus maynei TaxID=6958 RepID=A0A1Y3BTR1_EURMA|nr:Group 13 mite allergen-like protein (Lipocalin) [Euroglyphus maynei]